ncbi:hypothetical protein DUI87_09457 [Hirundo rustica rustica]|uniref:Uncharacterized protein n=1 Tax=Hirundo rustica rustica TaxID=333673 RepID=A0A3M0KM96_HIRRU|nr:hypothetical protein DUI87_09457 [Hirundo rustica rustica]
MNSCTLFLTAIDLQTQRDVAASIEPCQHVQNILCNPHRTPHIHPSATQSGQKPVKAPSGQTQPPQAAAGAVPHQHKVWADTSGTAMDILKQEISRKHQHLGEKELLGGNECFKHSELDKKEEEAYFQRCVYKVQHQEKEEKPTGCIKSSAGTQSSRGQVTNDSFQTGGSQEAGDDDSQNDLKVIEENTTSEELEALGESLGWG